SQSYPAAKAEPVYARRPELVQDFQSAALALSGVDDHGSIRGHGQRDQFSERLLLLWPERLLDPVAVETNFPDRKRFLDVVAHPVDRFTHPMRRPCCRILFTSG